MLSTFQGWYVLSTRFNSLTTLPYITHNSPPRKIHQNPGVKVQFATKSATTTTHIHSPPVDPSHAEICSPNQAIRPTFDVRL